jgi:hypothetical protein
LSTVQEFERLDVAKGSHSFEWEAGKSTFQQIDTNVTDVKTTPSGRNALPARGSVELDRKRDRKRDQVDLLFCNTVKGGSFDGGSQKDRSRVRH